jgi:hypothetical protein
MLPLRLCRVVGIRTICTITAKELLHHNRVFAARRFALPTTSYCTQIKKDDITMETVKNAELLQVG